jgi:hypothetical protein
VIADTDLMEVVTAKDTRSQIKVDNIREIVGEADYIFKR